MGVSLLSAVNTDKVIKPSLKSGTFVGRMSRNQS